jgi:peptidoglycan/xylan/chitin deacetylase (PgdA/CDA1 family)
LEYRKAIASASDRPKGEKKVAKTGGKPSGAASGSSALSNIQRGLKNEGVDAPISLPPGVKLSYSRVSGVGGPFVAMTFDDGPHPSNTPKLLDILAARNVKATFYVVGTNAKRYPAILRRMVAEGHEIGNHTVNHASLSRMSNSGIETELQGCHDAVLGATGVAPRTMRPPYGAVNDNVRGIAYNEFGYPTIMWSVDPEDWKRPGSSVVASRLIKGANNGAILLAHDIHSPTIAAMPDALDGLLSKGFRFVTVSQLISMSGTAEAAAPAEAGIEAPEVPEIALSR